jgi:hypothetical protein
VALSGSRRSVDAVSRRTAVYLGLRLAAALVFVGAATLLPPGLPAALLVVAGGVLAVAACFGVNAGGPGEQAGSRPQDRWFDSLRAPQGDWPPYDPGTVVEGEVVRPTGATSQDRRAS